MVDWWDVLPDSERRHWTLTPFASVGPIGFGMTCDEVSAALGAVAADSRAGTKAEYRELGLTLYYGRDGRMRGIVADALRGPQVFVDGMALVGRAPSVVERWLLGRAEEREPGTELSYMDAGVPGSESLGVVVSAQRAGDHLLTRPVFVPSEAMDDLPHFLPDEVWDLR